MTTANDLPSPTADEAFGLVVHEAMFAQRVSQTKLAAALSVHQTTLSKKLHGERPWTLADAIAIADALRLDLRDLLGRMWRDPGTAQSGAVRRVQGEQGSLP
jgi:transcriptional regulator with XRE-family HTH domain